MNALITAAQAGDKEAAEEILRRMESKVTKLAVRCHKLPHELEDLRQAGRLGVVNAIKHYRVDFSDAKFTTYVTRAILTYIFRFLDYDTVIRFPPHVPKEKRYSVDSLDFLISEGVSLIETLESPPPPEISPLLEYLETLPYHEQELLAIGAKLTDKQFKDVAEESHTSKTQIWRRYQRLRKRLREKAPID